MIERMVEIRGKRVTEEDSPELKGRIGPDEAAVMVTHDELMRQLAEHRMAELRGAPCRHHDAQGAVEGGEEAKE